MEQNIQIKGEELMGVKAHQNVPSIFRPYARCTQCNTKHFGWKYRNIRELSGCEACVDSPCFNGEINE